MPEFNQSATISNENRFSNTSKSSGIAAASTYLTSLLTSKDELKPCKSFSSNLAPETTTTAQPKSAGMLLMLTEFNLVISRRRDCDTNVRFVFMSFFQKVSGKLVIDICLCFPSGC